MRRLYVLILMTALMKNGNAQETTYPDWLNRTAYPFKSNYFKTDAGTMHYLDEGYGDPIVMVHGNPGWSFEFRHVIQAVSKTHRCIAPDHIGFGLSDKPFDWDYLPANHAKNFEKLLDSLNLQNITLIVNDWGGPIGLNYAIKHPERIKKLVILNTWLWDVTGDKHFEKFSKLMGGAFGRFMIRNFNFFGKVVVKKAVGDKSKLTDEVHHHYYDHLEKRRDRKGCYVFPREIIQSGHWLDSLWQQRSKIAQIPATIIWGEKDIAFRQMELDKWIANWPHAKVIKLKDVGHYPQEESPETVIQELMTN